MASPDLGKMVGPLPLGAWVAVVGGGLAFMVYQRRQADVTGGTVAADTMTPSDPSSPPGVGDGSVGGWVPTTPPTGITPPAITDNDSWGVNAINWLIAQGYDPAVADSAIRKYLDQEAGYSAQEFAMVRFAIGHLGATPTPLPAPVFGKPPVPVGGSKPPAKPPVKTPPVVHKPAPKPHVRYYTVRPGDTLTGIGRKYHVSWQSIYNENKYGHRRADGSKGMIRNYNLIHVGWRLVIPN